MTKLIKQAFTLIELLVVIAIIGILSGLIVVAMGGVTQKANIAKSQIFSNSLRNALMLNLVSEWKLDGGTAGNNATAPDILDSWSINNAVSVIGTPVIKGSSDCVLGNCLSFNGSSYVNFGNIHNSVFSSNFSLSLWFKTNYSSADWITYLIEKGNNNLPYFSVGITGAQYGTSANRLSIRHNNDTGLGLSSKNYVDNNWHNIVVVRNLDSSSTILYIDSVPEAPLGNIVYTSFTSNLTVGSACGDRSFNGFIDEVRIYNTVMSASQIKEQYYAGLNNLLSSGQINRKEYNAMINSIAKQ